MANEAPPSALMPLIINMFSESYIARSRQLWKLWVSFLLLIAGFVMFTLALSPSDQRSEKIGVVLFMSGIGLSLISFLWVCFSVKCRSCGSCVVWRAMRQESAQNWLNSLLSAKACPVCHDIPTSEAQR